MDSTLPLAEVKTQLSAIVDVVASTQARVIITRNGRPVAALVAVDDLAALEETLDILGDPEAMRQIREAGAEEPVQVFNSDQDVRALLAEHPDATPASAA